MQVVWFTVMCFKRSVKKKQNIYWQFEGHFYSKMILITISINLIPNFLLFVCFSLIETKKGINFFSKLVVWMFLDFVNCKSRSISKACRTQEIFLKNFFLHVIPVRLTVSWFISIICKNVFFSCKYRNHLIFVPATLLKIALLHGCFSHFLIQIVANFAKRAKCL